MDYDSIIKEYQLAGNLIPVNPKSSDVISHYDYATRLRSGEDVTGLIPTVENPEWILKGEKGEIYSGNSQGDIIKVPATRNKIMVLEKAKQGLYPKHVIRLSIDEDKIKQKFLKIKNLKEGKKEDNDMAELDKLFKDLNPEAIGEIQATADEMAGAVNADLNNAFENTTKMDLDSTGMKEAGMEEDSMMHIKLLGDFNRKYGRLHFLVTTQDHKVNFTTAKAATRTAGKAGGGTDSANQGNANATTSGTSEVRKLVAKDGKPGPVKGGLISIPNGGLFTAAELKTGKMMRNGVETDLRPDVKQTDLTYILLDKDELIDQILVSFDGLIREDVATYGTFANEIEAVERITKDKDGNEKSTLRLAPPKKASLVRTGAYFPLKMFKYLPVKPADEAELDVLNFSAFYQLFKVSEKKGAMYNNLDVSSQNLVNQDPSKKMVVDDIELPKISSQIYTMAGMGKTSVECTRWNSKNDKYNEIAVPRKRASKNKKGDVTARIVTVDCLRCMEEDAKYSSLEAEQFKPLRDRFSSFLNRETLVSKFGSNRGRTSNKVEERRRETRKNLRRRIHTDKMHLSVALDDIVNSKR